MAPGFAFFPSPPFAFKKNNADNMSLPFSRLAYSQSAAQFYLQLSQNGKQIHV